MQNLKSWSEHKATSLVQKPKQKCRRSQLPTHMAYKHPCFTQQSLSSNMLTPHVWNKSEDDISRHLCISCVHFELALLTYGMSGLFRLQSEGGHNLLSENVSQTCNYKIGDSSYLKFHKYLHKNHN